MSTGDGASNLTMLGLGIDLVLLFLVAVVAGALGALLGLGGGVIIVPTLTLFLGVDIHEAIGASLVSVVATSSGAAARFFFQRTHLVNLRIALFLELGAAAGALIGALAASFLAGRILFGLFAIVLFYSAIATWRSRHRAVISPTPLSSPLVRRLRLQGQYYDVILGRVVAYHAARVGIGLALMLGAGLASGLLGIGSGILKVPAMDSAMALPLKVSSATSNFMIGMTAAASAGLYFSRGEVNPLLAGPLAIGVLVGASFGGTLLHHVPETIVRHMFVVVLIVVAAQMAVKAFS